MHSAIDLLYSRYSGAHWVGPDLHLALAAAYLLKSSGEPGVDPGSAWTQEAELVLYGAAIESQEDMHGAANIRAARIELDGAEHDLIPLPLIAQAARIEMHFDHGGHLRANAGRLSVHFFGRPLFVEENR